LFDCSNADTLAKHPNDLVSLFWLNKQPVQWAFGNVRACPLAGWALIALETVPKAEFDHFRITAIMACHLTFSGQRHKLRLYLNDTQL
jgi:hypothetical protein